ncbi:MAG: DUF2179 domain-containing protein [Gemmataceae bacterium]|nr:DUF2179 domain-containing protein [Gemmataceae bacterium]
MGLLGSITLGSLSLPLMVFVAEMCVVTLSTLRIIFIARGRRLLAPLLGFFEITIWLFAIGQIMKNLGDVGCFMGFAAGFTSGSYLGILIEKRLALGTLVVRIITTHDAAELIVGLKEAGFGVTRMHGEGTTGPVQVVFSVIQRRELSAAVGVIKRFDPHAFYSVEDVQMAAAGVFPLSRRRVSGAPSTVRPAA